MHPATMFKAVFFSFFSMSQLTAAHSWIDQLMVIAPNGTMVGQPGFSRNYVPRSPSFKDSEMVFLIPPDGGPINVIAANQSMCRPDQTTQTQSSGSPRLQASPGQSVALRYQENGHVTLPQNQPGKPGNRGTNFVYYTTESTPDDKFLQIHRQWTPDGKGGDGRGRLLSTQNFDDGQCYQINSGTISTERQSEFKHVADPTQGAALWCQTDIQIPADAQPNSTITLYWVWDWPTMPGTTGFPDGKQELYTTCMDVDIVHSAGQSKAVARNFVKQDFGEAAIASQFGDIANPTAIKAETIPFSGVSSASSTSAAAATATAPSAAVTTTSSLSTIPDAATTTQSSTSPSPTAAEVTITVQETVTATVIQTESPTTTPSPSVAVVTTIETDFVTVTDFNTIANKRTIATIAPSESTSCSKTASAYLLRARKPFYILPSSDMPGDGC